MIARLEAIIQPSIAAMLTYVSRFFSGGLEPFWPHFVLLSFAVLASVAVGAGIIFERPEYRPFIHKIAFWLVVAGIAVEATCTIFLFAFDEGISQAQQSKIVALETHIAQRELSPEETSKLRAAISAIPDSLPHKVVFSYLMGDEESKYLAYEIGRHFISFNWSVDATTRSYATMQTWGISIFGPDNAITHAVQGAFRAAKIPFSDKDLPGGFLSYGHQPLPDETVVFIGPKEPAISAEEAATAGFKPQAK